MGSLYGNRWRSAQGAYDADGIWYGELKHLTSQAIQRGILRCREAIRNAARSNDTAWPPQAAEFVILCEPTPADYGLPSTGSAWDEVNNHSHDPDGHKWSHQAVRLAARQVSGGFASIHGTTSVVRRKTLFNQFERHYLALVNRLLAGKDLEEQGLIESDTDKSAVSITVRSSNEFGQKQAERFTQFSSHESAMAECRRQLRAGA